MTTREDLERIANHYRNLPGIRAEAITKARAEGMTWREIASLLEMTEHGVIKADRVHREAKPKP